MAWKPRYNPTFTPSRKSAKPVDDPETKPEPVVEDDPPVVDTKPEDPPVPISIGHPTTPAEQAAVSPAPAPAQTTPALTEDELADLANLGVPAAVVDPGEKQRIEPPGDIPVAQPPIEPTPEQPGNLGSQDRVAGDTLGDAY